MEFKWPQVQIDSVCSLIVDCVNKTAPVVSHKTAYRMIRTTNIKSGRLDISTCKYVSEHTFAKWTRRAVPSKGDVLLTREAPLGEIAMIRGESNVFLGQRIMQYRADPKKIDPEFLYYSFLAPDLQAQIHAHSGSGSTVDHIRVPECSKFLVAVPPLKEQREIAGLLGALDERITTLTRSNETLEAMARAIFKSWFVDFDPVRAKAEGLEPEGMDAATVALFPSKFQDSEIGPIPEGWKLIPFGDLLASSIGGDWGKETADDANTEGVFIVRGTDMPDIRTGRRTRMPYRFVNQKKLSSRRLLAGDIVIEVSGGSPIQPTGRSLYFSGNLLEQFDRPVVPASFCRLFRPLTVQIGIVLAQHLSYIYKQGKTWSYQNQSTGISNFQTAHFLQAEMVVQPSPEVLERFYALVDPLLRKTQLQQVEILENLRDTLLPRLISGKLRVPETEAMLAEAL